MPRRRIAAKREIIPDPLYHSQLIAKFVNYIMNNGKKSVAERIVYDALKNCQQRCDKGEIKLSERESSHNVNAILEASQQDSGGVSGEENQGLNATRLLKMILDAVRPFVEVRSRRVGGSTYQVPMEVRAERQIALAMRWIVEAAKNRHEKTMKSRLAAEFADILSGRGAALKKREDVHRMANANKAFAHYRW